MGCISRSSSNSNRRQSGTPKRSRVRPCLILAFIVPAILRKEFGVKTASAVLVRPRGFQHALLSKSRHPELHAGLFTQNLDALDYQTDTAFEECWSQTSWTVNPDGDIKIDAILQGLVSPAPQSFFVLQRMLNSYRTTSFQKQQQERHLNIPYQHLLKVGHDLVFRDAIFSLETARHQAPVVYQPGVDWSVQPRSMKCRDGWSVVVSKVPSKSLNQMATEVLDIETSNPDLDDNAGNNETSSIQTIIQQMENQLDLTLGTDVRGRSAADTAFVLALAGVVAPTLFRLLYKVVRLELLRVQDRSSRRSKDVLHIIEKVAASGACASECSEVEQIYQAAAAFLEGRHHHPDVVHSLRTTGSTVEKYNLLSPRPLLWLWRFSSRLTKPTAQPYAQLNDQKQSRVIGASLTPAWLKKFENKKSPLVIDIGCGFGVSLLGLASIDESKIVLPKGSLLTNGLNWVDCNYVGCDLNPLMTRFACGITSRWSHLNHERLQFVRSSAEDLLKEVLLFYQGNVALILLQFPTPYRLQDDAYIDGNSQLPVSEEECMASPNIIALIASILRQKGNGRLLIQSNCEDVAVRLRNLAIQHQLDIVLVDPWVQIEDLAARRTTQRTEKWIQYQRKRGVECERAAGFGWCSQSVLPPGCATETEVACEFEGTPVHRCILQS